ncbi:hypothetical protein D3C86_1886610 [compost metagenome]
MNLRMPEEDNNSLEWANWLLVETGRMPIFVRVSTFTACVHGISSSTTSTRPADCRVVSMRLRPGLRISASTTRVRLPVEAIRPARLSATTDLPSFGRQEMTPMTRH